MSILAGLTTTTETLVDSAGYTGLALVMLAENALPIPSEVVLPVVGLQVSSGQLLLWAAALSATAGR